MITHLVTKPLKEQFSLSSPSLLHSLWQIETTLMSSQFFDQQYDSDSEKTCSKTYHFRLWCIITLDSRVFLTISEESGNTRIHLGLRFFDLSSGLLRTFDFFLLCIAWFWYIWKEDIICVWVFGKCDSFLFSIFNQHQMSYNSVKQDCN